MADYSIWDLAKAKKEQQALVPEWVQENLDFYDGDHWQNGAGYTGPKATESETASTAYLNLMEPIFVSKNVIAEGVDRHIAAVIGKRMEVEISVKRMMKEDEEPTNEEQALIDQVNMLVTDWLDGQQGIIPRKHGKGVRKTSVHEVQQRMTIHELLARRGILRWVVDPSAVMVNEQTGEAGVPGGEPEDIAKRLFISVPSPGQAAVYTDEDDLSSCGIYVYMKDDKEFCELTYLNEQGQTILRVIGKDDDKPSEPMQLDGRLLMAEFQREEMVSPSIRSLQKALNKSETMQSINTDSAFPEWTYINVERPGTLIDDPDNPGEKIISPGVLEVGPKRRSFLYAAQIIDETTGDVKFANPMIDRREPSPPDTFIGTSQDYYDDMLGEFDQRHALMSGDAVASGESRIAAKDEFRKSLYFTIPQVEAAGRWLVETLLKLTAVLSGSPDLFNEIKVTVRCDIDLGTPGVDEIRMISEAYNAGLIDLQTAVARVTGADNVDEVISRIQQEEIRKLEMLERQLKAIELLVSNGADVAAAAEVVGIEPEIASKLGGRRLIPAAVNGGEGNNDDTELQETDDSDTGR